MPYIKCSGCHEIIEIPDELAPEHAGGEINTLEPYYCDACERIAELAADIDTTEYCPHCEKDLDDWADLGCEYCDRRHPDYGTLD